MVRKMRFAHFIFLILRIMNTVKLWVDDHPHDFDETQSFFFKQFYNFVSKNIAIDFPSYALKICDILDGTVSILFILISG